MTYNVDSTHQYPDEPPAAPSRRVLQDDAQKAAPVAASAIPPRIGLVAGWGRFPIEVAERCRANGIEVQVAAIKGHADPYLTRLATELRWFGVAKLGAQLRYFSRAGIQHVTLAGKLFKDRILHQGWGWIQHLPDWQCVRTFGSVYITRSKDARDDTLLTAIVEAYRKRAMQVLPVTRIAPQLLAEQGCLTKRKPTRAQQIDIQFGWDIARRMGGLDIGQSISVKDQMVLGVEAIEGTDALIQRTGKLCPRGGFTLIKVAKPNQDMRFDVPTIGLRTVQQLVSAGGKTLAIEAGKTIMVERDETLAFAERHGLSIVSLEAKQATTLTDISASFRPQVA